MKLYLAGMESATKLKMAADLGVKYVLVSAYALVKKKGSLALIQEYSQKGMEFFCDSGAFTIMSAKLKIYDKGLAVVEATVEKRMDEIRPFFEKLCSFYREHGDLFTVLAEFDVGSRERKEAFRKELEDAAGRKLLPTWSTTDGVGYIDVLAEDYDYIGVGGFSGSSSRDIRAALPRAAKRNVKCHAWGVTSDRILRRSPWYSAASTSWLSGSRYGATYIFRQSRLVNYSRGDKGERRKLGRKFEEAPAEWGLDFAAFCDDEAKAVDRWNLLQWRLYADYIRESWLKRKPYWIESECTCDDGRGSCKVHGVGLSGNPPPIIVTQSQEVKDKISKAQRGNLNALVHGKRSPRLPQLQCDACYLSDRCKGYEEGAACKFDPEFSALAELVGSGEWEDLVEFQRTKLHFDSGRYMRGVVFEAADGGLIDKGVTQLSAHLSNEVALLAKLRGYLSDAPHVDNRQIQLIIEGMPDSQYERLLDAVCEIREVAPVLLEGPGNE